MHISELSIRRPVLSVVISLFLILIGLASYEKLTIREYPDIDNPVVSVTTVYRGASSEIVERDVTQIIEDSLSGISDIREISSTSKDEVSSIRVEFNLGRNMDDATNDVRDKVARIASKLPQEADNPTVAKSDSDARQAVMWIGFTSNQLDSIELNDYLERNIIDRLSILPGVASVRIGGERKYAMRVWLNPNEMAARNVTTEEILSAINKENIERPAGRIESIEREMNVQVNSKLENLDMFKKIVIKEYENKRVNLEDISSIEIGPESDRGFLRANKKNAIGLGIVRQTKSNVLEVAKAVKEELSEIEPTLPENIEMTIGYDQSTFVNESISEVRRALLIAMLMVIAVIYYFLYSPAATIIPTLTIPVSIISTFSIIYFFGYSLNVLTFLALVLAIGLIVDDSIVVLENIKRRIEGGEEPYRASIDGAKQITFVVIATTVVLVSVFLPLSFMGGKTGRLFIEFGVVLSFAVVISSLIALTLTPMLCSKIMKPNYRDQNEPELLKKFKEFYGMTLKFSQENVKKIYIFSTLVIFISFILYQFIPKELAPTEDRGIFIISVQGPEGSTLEYTDKIVKEVESKLQPYIEKNEINTLFSIVAPGFSGEPGSVNSAFLFASLEPWDDRDRHQKEIVKEIFPKLLSIPGARIFTINPPSLGQSPFRSSVQVVISADNYRNVGEWGNILLNETTKLNLRAPNIDYKVNNPRLNLKIDREKASDLGISSKQLTTTIETLFASNRVTTFSERGLTYNVILQADRSFRMTPDNFNAIFLKSPKHEKLIPLSNFVSYEETSASKELKRINRMPSTVLSASLIPGYPLGNALQDITNLSKNVLPANAKLSFTGSSKEYFESGNKLELTILFAILVVYLVLAAQFESFINPLTIILTVPIAITAGLYTLFVIGASLNVYSQIGFLMLIALIAKNGILVVEFANKLREQGETIEEAIYKSSMIRLRPVLMTTISTMFGAIPLILSSGAGAESRYSMAVVVFGGITLSALITLYLIPALYKFIENRRST